MDQGKNNDVLLLRDCAQVALSTGHSATTLRELRGELERAPEASLYHHFWGRYMLPAFDEPEYNNDFASWVHRSLHDKPLAERLSALNPTHYATLEDLRAELIDQIEARIEESEVLPWRMADHGFHFMRAQMIVFDSGLRVRSAAELRSVLETVSTGAIFYHFIDARRRTEQHCDDFSCWLRSLGEEHLELAAALEAEDPYFSSLEGIRRRLINVFDEHLKEAEHVLHAN
jgi:hypothetical protein